MSAKQRKREDQSRRYTSKSTRNIFAETKKTKNYASEKPNPKRRMVVVEYLQQKIEKEMALEKEEMELRCRELGVKEEKLGMQNQQQNDMIISQWRI